jgi:hypothetical protein
MGAALRVSGWHARGQHVRPTCHEVPPRGHQGRLPRRMICRLGPEFESSTWAGRGVGRNDQGVLNAWNVRGLVWFRNVGGYARSLGQPSGLGAITVPGIRPTTAGATNLTAGSRLGVINRTTRRLGTTPAAAGRLGIAPTTRSVIE